MAQRTRVYSFLGTAPTPAEVRADRHQKLCEVRAMIDQGGFTFAAAVELIAIDVADESELPPLDSRFGYLPTPAEIAAACREIQAGWNHIDRRTRQVMTPATPWAVPTVVTGELGAA